MYNRKVQGWFKHLDFILLDCVCLYLSLLLAYMIRMGSWRIYIDEDYSSISLVLLLADIAVAMLFDTFKNVLKRGDYREFSITVKHVCLVEAVIIVYFFTIRQSATYSRIVIYLMGMIYALSSYCVRLWWKKHLRKVMKRGRKRSLLIVTTSDMAEEAVGNIIKYNYEQFRLEGVIFADSDKEDSAKSEEDSELKTPLNEKELNVNGIPVIGMVSEAAEYICRKWVDEVLILLPPGIPFPEKMASQCLEMGVVVHRGLFKASEDYGQKQLVERLGNYTVLTTSINVATGLQQFIKRSMDILGGLAGCVVTAVLFVILAPVIYIKSPGPVLFVQERVGRNGKRFKMYKFRSMYLDAEARKQELMEQNRYQNGPLFKLEGDPRIIGSRVQPDGTVKKGFGNYIRELSLDEFPQFFNVLKGDMSLVGTRPPTVDEWEKYELHHRARLAIRPGITGLWQVSGRNDVMDFERVVELDTKYIAEWSIGLDVKILLKTVMVILKREGAM